MRITSAAITLLAFTSPVFAQEKPLAVSHKKSTIFTSTNDSCLRQAPLSHERLPYISSLGLYGNESPLDESGKRIHFANAAQTDRHIQSLLNPRSSLLSTDELYQTITDHISDVFKNFNASPYRAVNPAEKHGYSKTLLLSYGTVAIQIFIFTGQQQTPIHDHPGSCKSFTLAVNNGTLTEDLYELPHDHTQPQLKLSQVRSVGSTGVVGPAGEAFNGVHQHEHDVHRLKFECHDPQGNCLAVHLHVYKGIDGISKHQQASVKSIYPSQG